MNNNFTPDNNLVHHSFKIKINNKLFDLPKISSQVNFFQNELLNIGLQTGDYAAIICENNIEYLVSILSLWQIGAIPVLINTRLTKSEIEEQISFCKIVLLSRLQKEIFSEFKISSIETCLSEETSSSLELVIQNSKNPAVVIYTSGSNSKPKAVELSFNSLYKSFLSCNKILNQSETDRWLASLPFYHIGGFSIFTRSMFSGSTLVFPENLSLESIQQAIGEKKPTLTSLVSPQLKRFVENNFSPNIELRITLVGGGFIENALIVSALNLGWKIFKVYGATETASFVTILSQKDFELKNNSAGKAILPNKIAICDETGEPLPPNISGEITVSSDSLFSKYLFDEETTSQKLKNGIYYSGDIGYIDSDGFLFVEARRTDLIVSGGENINSIEVESVIKKFPLIKEVCVFPIIDKKWGQKAAAAIVLEEQGEMEIEKLKIFLKAYLADFKIPKEFYFCNSLPKSSLGKILREKVVEMFDFKNE